MVDFTKDIQTESGLAARHVFTFDSGLNDYPFLIVIPGAGEDVVDQANEHGETRSGQYVIVNKPEPPKVVYARLFKDEEGAFYFDENAYDSEAEATDAGDRYQLVGIVPVTVPGTGDAAPAAEGSLDTVEIDGVVFRAGSRVYFRRPRRGWRWGHVVKVRSNDRSSLFVQPDDGSRPYWALNRNVQTTDV